MEKIFVLTAGHDDKDPGLVVGQWKEEELATELRDATAEQLRGFGFTVLEDGKDGQNLPLSSPNIAGDAIDLASKYPGRGLEYHFNSGATSATGVEAFSLPQYKPLAKAVAGAVAVALGLPLRGAGGWKAESESPRKRLGYVRAGGIVLEVCFLTNPNDRRAYLENKKAVARAVATAINSTLR